MDDSFKKDIVNGIGVYLTELGEYPVLLFNDHEYVFSTPDNIFAWTRDGMTNTPETRKSYGKIKFKLYDLKETCQTTYIEKDIKDAP